VTQQDEDATEAPAVLEHGATESGSRWARPGPWALAVSAFLVAFFGAQLVAGWKYLNDQTYPIVGSAMFNGPPTPESNDFLVPRVFARTSSGARVELDQRTFGLEPFEWRAWITDNLEHAPQDEADEVAADLARTFAIETGVELSSIELWRIPSMSDDLGRGRLVVAVDL
jgi:hypothetical protein